eukprot:CAMPEP_0185703746 /NCGR_PEP_ID=MMETSP1164-20130828/15396_1 /TAXON_ID=1104430 /ORGANISM="Chrysoreinhardia sp, Strain CCMP2950" /LENGTH=287 /DNA_ID=CAMNT_0028371055 /DNA_START=1 /DNA_END=864 /DNA_ORIENTATION=-
MPAVGYGLYQIPPADAAAATRTAIEIGYRHLDSASFYANEAEVGHGIRDANIARGELSVASKVWTDVIGLGGAAVERSVRTSVELLGVGYLDCCYVHWPCAGHVEAYRALERLVDDGVVRSIGLSNYRVEDVEALGETRVAPVANQIEINPWMHRKDAIQFFRDRGIALVAYKPLLRGAGPEKDPRVGELAELAGVTPAQLLLRWGLDKGFAVIPKSTHPGRMRQNLDAASLSPLSADATAYLDSLTPSESAVAETFEAHFAKRAVVDPSGPTLAVYGPPPSSSATA